MISYGVELLVLMLVSPVIVTLLKELSKYRKAGYGQNERVLPTMRYNHSNSVHRNSFNKMEKCPLRRNLGKISN